jgi:hypothetical protein
MCYVITFYHEYITRDETFVHADVYKSVRVGVQEASDVNSLFTSQSKDQIFILKFSVTGPKICIAAAAVPVIIIIIIIIN